MSFVLNGLVLPKHNELKQEIVEISSRNYTITGKTKKDVVRVKNKFILKFENITNTEFNNIYNVHKEKEAVSLLIDEPYLNLGTTVNVEISGANRKWGGSFIELTLILEEV